MAASIMFTMYCSFALSACPFFQLMVKVLTHTVAGSGFGRDGCVLVNSELDVMIVMRFETLPR